MNLFYKIILLISIVVIALCCDPCYRANLNENCANDPNSISYYTLHMSVHPHLDAFWIFDFESYYDPKPNQYQVHSYFASNRFNSVKQIFNTATQVLSESKQYRQKNGSGNQRAHRSFFNSQMGFFKRWYSQQNKQTKQKVKQLLKTKYWEIVGGGYVEHDQGCAYYDDIIENYQIGLRFLKEQIGYYPKAAISADSFGHSQTTLAILAHLGIQGYFVQRSDQHILLQNKTQFIWKAKSANGKYYGALPTHIRWAIHGFEDQFIGNNPNQKICQTKQMYINNLRRQNQFLKRILKSNHIMRYFGHDFQRFDNYSYSVIQGFMEQFSKEKCNRVISVYGNPTQYFQTLMGQVWKNKVKPIATRVQDIFPIWDYDSGLYWTGYYTTDPYHKKNYRNAGRILHALRKAFLPSYIVNSNSQQNKKIYDNLQKLSQLVSYAQHHDGISGTSKYTVMDSLQNKLTNAIKNTKDDILNVLFETQFPINTNNPIFNCGVDQDCVIPPKVKGDVFIKIFNSAGDRQGEPIKIHLPDGQYYRPDCQFQLNCLCHQLPCKCTLYLYPRLFTYTSVRLKKAQIQQMQPNKLIIFKNNQKYSYNETHFLIKQNNKQYSIGYKKIIAQPTGRSYAHLSRFGDQGGRSFSIRSGKYALGNNPNKIQNLSKIKNIYTLDSQKLKIIIIKWKRQQMKTIITIRKDKSNQWKLQTYSAAQGQILQDLYLQIGTSIKNDNKFFTDSNGWLVMQRTLFKHQDYQAYFSPQKYDDVDGNSYPMTAFCYIQDSNDKVSVNTDRPQGVIAYQPGKLWINFDRLSSDDGKWVYENTYRHQYQRFTHIVTVGNNDYNQRKIQVQYDQPMFVQGNVIQPNQRVEQSNYDFELRDRWASIAGIDGLKFMIKPWNDSTVTVRVHNLNDKQQHKVGIYANKTSPFLTTFYGNQIRFENIQESSLGGNMNYKQFLDKKWNWNQVIDLKQQNQIFNKKLQQNIILRPLEIRTFTFKGLKVIADCQGPQKLTYNGKSEQQNIQIDKPMTLRSDPICEQKAGQYLQFGNHCNESSPITSSNNKNDHKQSVKKQPKRQQPKKQPKKQQPKKQQPKKQEPNKKVEVTISYQQIKKKVQNLLKISRQQKFIYFTERFKQIKAQK